jgi:Flp pilus assembly protein TadD
MKLKITIGLWPRLIFVSLAVGLLGLAPRPHAYRQALEQARLALDAGRQKEAAAAIRAAAQLAPGRADLWEQAGIQLLRSGDFSGAEANIAAARREGGDQALSLQGWMALGDAYRGSGLLTDAISAWSAAIERYRPTVELLARLESAHLKTGDWEAAASDLRKQLELAQEDAGLYYRLGMILSVTKPEDALDPLDQAAQLDARFTGAAASMRRAVLSAHISDSPAYTLVTVGRALAGLGEWDLAAEAFRRAVRLRPDYAEAWAYLGEACQHPKEGTLGLSLTGSESDGLKELQTALELDPKSLAARTFLALYWTRQGDAVQALQVLREAAALDPNNPALQVQLASLLAETGDLDGAQQAYERAIDLSPYDPTYRRALIGFFIDYDYQIDALALPRARDLVAAYPDDPAVLGVMGRVLLKQNDLSGAERFLDRALESDPQYPDAHMYLGLVYVLRGERDAARREFNLAVQLGLGGPVEAQARRLLQTYFP